MTDLTEQWKKGRLEIIGKKFGNLTVLEFDHKDRHYHRYYKCVCDCGNETVVNESNLKRAFNMNNFEKIKEYEAHKTPVPSYEEWQASEKYNKHLKEVIKVYERKDKQATETSIAYNELAKENARILLMNKINEVLK